MSFMGKLFPKAERKGDIFENETKIIQDKNTYNTILKKIENNNFETEEQLLLELNSTQEIGQINKTESKELIALFNKKTNKAQTNSIDFSDIISYEIDGKAYADTEITPDKYEQIDAVYLLFYDKEHLPESLKLLKNLKILNLKESFELKELPTWLPTLVHLEELNLQDSSINLNVAELIKLKNLKKLNIQGIKRSSIVDSSNPDSSEEEKEIFKQETIKKFTERKKGVEILKTQSKTK